MTRKIRFELYITVLAIGMFGAILGEITIMTLAKTDVISHPTVCPIQTKDDHGQNK